MNGEGNREEKTKKKQKERNGGDMAETLLVLIFSEKAIHLLLLKDLE